MTLQEVILKKIIQNFDGKIKKLKLDFIEMVDDFPETVVQRIVVEISPFQLEKIHTSNEFLVNFIKNRWKTIFYDAYKTSKTKKFDYCQLYFQNLLTDKFNQEPNPKNPQGKKQEVKKMVNEYGKYVKKLALWRNINKEFYSVRA